MTPHENTPRAAVDDCCVSKNVEPEEAGGTSAPSRAGLLSSGGAVLGAMLASACCWLPLLLIGLGVSTVGVAGFFEAYRPYFLGVSGVLLVAGFYYVYLRKPRCAPGSACEVPRPGLKRLNKISLWVATVLVVAFAAFPNYVGVFFGSDGSGTAAAAQTSFDVLRIYAVEGMTCEGCAGHIRAAVAALPGVKAVEVSFAAGTATVVFEHKAVDDQAVVQAVASAGYTAHPPVGEAAR